MLQNQTVVVVGGAGLLGKVFSRAIGDAGASVAVADVNIEAAQQVAGELTGVGHKARAYQIDITSSASIDEVFRQVDGELGNLTGVVNAAYPRNRQYGAKLEDVTYRDFCENIDLHLGGYFLLSQRAGAFLLEKTGGSVVNLASIYGTMAPRFEIYEGTSMTMPVEYAAIKAGVIHLTRYFAQYFKKTGIRFNTLSPGGILAAQPDAFLRGYSSYSGAKGMLEGTDVCGTLLYLLSESARFVTGQNIIVDDGFSL